LSGGSETFRKRSKGLTVLKHPRNPFGKAREPFGHAGPAGGSERGSKGFDGWEAKMRKPVQANIAVVGAGMGVLSFAAGEYCLSSRAPMAAPRRLRRLPRFGANENDLETEFSERQIKVAALGPKRP
jgi:hypothetical protein